MGRGDVCALDPVDGVADNGGGYAASVAAASVAVVGSCSSWKLFPEGGVGYEAPPGRSADAKVGEMPCELRERYARSRIFLITA